MSRLLFGSFKYSHNDILLLLLKIIFGNILADLHSIPHGGRGNSKVQVSIHGKWFQKNPGMAKIFYNNMFSQEDIQEPDSNWNYNGQYNGKCQQYQQNNTLNT